MRSIWLDSGEDLSADALRAEEVIYAKVAIENCQTALDELKRARGYVRQDEVHMHPGMPNLDAICAKFSAEHLHDDDEVRFVLDGEGVFEIRAKSDRLMRVVVARGDLIVVPARRNHRFILTESRTIRAVRLFKDESGWVPRYRAAS